MDEFRFDRCKSVLMGCFIGDAMGAPYEFSENTILKNEDAIDKCLFTSYKRITVYTRINKLPPKKFQKGTITDDSIFTIELLSSLSKEETIDERIRRYYDMVKNGGEFADETCGMFGKNTNSLFKNLRYSENYYHNFQSEPGEYATSDFQPESNGFLMRSSPLAFKPNFNQEDIINDVMITNPTENCVLLCIFYIYLIRCGLKGKDPSKSFEKTMSKTEEYPKINRIFRKVKNNEEFKASKDQSKKGWAFVAFYFALKSLKKFIDGKPFEKIIRWVIKQGGDTDTNAAIAGALLGSFIGFDEMMKNKILETNINCILKPYKEGEYIKYRRVPQKDWKKICKRVKRLIS